MLTLHQVRQIAQIIIEGIQAGFDEHLVLVDLSLKFTDEWVLLSDSERLMKTGDLSTAIAGNGPIAMFDSGDGRMLRTADSPEFHIEQLNSQGQS